MRIDSLTLKNFRNFGPEERTFDFDKNYTAVIGNNGRGKSSIIYGIEVALQAFMLGIPDAYNRQNSEHEIHIKDFGKYQEKQWPVSVEACVDIGKYAESIWSDLPEESTMVCIRRYIPKGKKNFTYKWGDIGDLRVVGDYLSQTVKAGHDTDLPVIASFHVDRLKGAGHQITPKGIYKRERLWEGYHMWMNMKYANFRYSHWLAYYDINLQESREYEGTREAFFEAVRVAVPCVSDLSFYVPKFKGEEFGLRFRECANNDNTKAILFSPNHSDGIHAMVEMVAELAFRCITLNGHHGIDAVKNSEGIVLIDEIDIHLHPNWQQHVLADLHRAFPNIQFIVTTHSPFIVQSLKKDQLINLDVTEIPMVEDPLAMDLDQVVTEVMNVESTRSVDFEEKYAIALNVFNQMTANGRKPELDDYVKLRDLMNRVVEPETNDPIYKAYLKAQMEYETNNTR